MEGNMAVRRALARRVRRAFVAVGLVVAALVPEAARALPVTFGFTAEVTGVQVNGTGSVDVFVGDTVTGFYRFESSTSDADPSATVGSYDGAVLGAWAQLGADLVVFAGGAPANNVTASDDSLPIAGDLYAVTLADPALDGTSFATFNGSPIDDAGFTITLDDLGGGALLASPDLPLTPPDPALAVATNSISIDGFTSANDGFRVSGTVLTLFLVPEPRLAMLLAIGILLAARCAHRPTGA